MVEYNSVKYNFIEWNSVECNFIECNSIEYINGKYQYQKFWSKATKIDKKSYKNIDFNYIGYITMKDSDYAKINSVNPLYLAISEVDGYFEEKNGTKYLILDSKDKNKEVFKKYTEL